MLFLLVLAFTGTALSALTAADLDPKYFELQPYLTNNSVLLCIGRQSLVESGGTFGSPVLLSLPD